jgi:Mrp family chromosome partitioning ATPase
LVVQPNKNHRRIVLRASNDLIRAKVNLLGIVVNRVDEQQRDSYYQYGAGYGVGYGVGYGYGFDEEDKFDDHDEELAGATIPMRRAA